MPGFGKAAVSCSHGVSVELLRWSPALARQPCLRASSGWPAVRALSVARIRRIRLGDEPRHFVTERGDKEFELDVVGIAKHQGGAVPHVSDSRVCYAVGLEMGHPSLQFVAIGDLKGKVI